MLWQIIQEVAHDEFTKTAAPCMQPLQHVRRCTMHVFIATGMACSTHKGVNIHFLAHHNAFILSHYIHL